MPPIQLLHLPHSLHSNALPILPLQHSPFLKQHAQHTHSPEEGGISAKPALEQVVPSPLHMLPSHLCFPPMLHGPARHAYSPEEEGISGEPALEQLLVEAGRDLSIDRLRQLFAFPLDKFQATVGMHAGGMGRGDGTGV